MIKKITKKVVKKIVMSVFICMLLTTANCFATTTNEEYIKNENGEYIIKTYSVSEKEEEQFLMNLQNEFKIEKKTYTIENKEKTGGNTIETIDINTTKTIISKSNKTADILKELPPELEYNENGYIGKYVLDTNSLEIKSQYNGYKEYLVEETKTYNNLATNDLDNIPKQIKKDGYTLDLLKTSWEITETKNLQDNEIPSKYKAICYYATKKRVDNPLTYIVTANYTGNAEKTIENNYTYKIVYKCTKENKNILPVIFLGGASLIVIFIIFTRKSNVTIYNYQDKEWKEIGKQKISKPRINLNRYNYKAVSNKYKIVLDEKLVDKYNGKMLKIEKQKRTIEKFINKANNVVPYTIEIII